MPSWKNIPSLKAKLGSGSHKTHPHFTSCFLFVLHQPVLKHGTSVQADRHTPQIHTKWLYLCWEIKWAREQSKEYCKAQLMFLQLSSLTLQSRGAAIQTGSHPWPSCYSLTMGSSWESARRSWPKPCQEVTNMSCHTPLPMSWHWWNTARVHRLGHGLGPRRYSVNVFSMNDSCEILGKLQRLSHLCWSIKWR